MFFVMQHLCYVQQTENHLSWPRAAARNSPYSARPGRLSRRIQIREPGDTSTAAARPPVIRTPQKVQMMGRGRGVDDEAAIEFDSMVCSLCNATSSDHYYS